MKKSIKYVIALMGIIYILFIFYKYQERQQFTKEESTYKTVVTSFYPMYIHTSRLIEGTDTKLINMASETVGCLHDYQLTTEDVKKIYEADLLITNGVDEMSLIEKVYAQNPDIQVVSASDTWLKHLEEDDHNHQHDEADSHGHEDEESQEDDHDHEHAVNDHVWLSVEGAMMQVEAIAESLIAYDAKNATLYEQNKTAYIEALQDLSKLQQEVADGTSMEGVTVHDTFDYLLQDLGIEVVTTLPEGMYENPSPKQVEEIIQEIEEHSIKVIFTEERYKDLTLLNTIQKETGIEIIVLDGMLGDEGRGTNYYERMVKNIEVIKELKK